MKPIRYFLFCVALLGIAACEGFSCDDLLGPGGSTKDQKQGPLINPANKSALVVYNTSGVMGAAGQPIGTVPKMLQAPLSPDSLRAAVTPRLLKDLPMRPVLGEPALARAAQAPERVSITDSTSSHTFVAITADSYITSIKATQRAAGQHCLVFVENGQEGTFDWQQIATLFDTQVWPKDTGLFGAPHIVGGNTKIVILYYKMRYSKTSKEEPYILGFFWSEDLEMDNTRSNKGLNIFYMNLSFGEPLHKEMQRTLFHEFQHMINYSTRVLRDEKPEMETWMNEGMAESAEHYGLDSYGDSRIKFMNMDPYGSLADGCSLAAWPDDADDTNYGLVYTFMQYLRIHASGGWNIMTSFITNAYGDYRALESVMGKSGGNSSLNTFAKMVEGYHLARFINKSTGINGFEGAEGFTFTPRAPTFMPNANTKLGPGAAIYIPASEGALDDYDDPGDTAGQNIATYKHYAGN